MKTWLIALLLPLAFLASCNKTQDIVKEDSEQAGIMFIYPDGTMMFNGRIMNEEDVVIYPDGYGGERAAVRVFVPLHSDYFRDTIPVERKDIKVERIE